MSHVLHKQRRGVTLIELMVVVAIVGILAAVGYPSYMSHLEKTRRGDCTEALHETAQRLERCRTTFGAYDDNDCSVNFPVDSEDGYYQITQSDLTGNTFQLDCQPAAGSPQVTDEMCAAMSLLHTGQMLAEDDGGADRTEYCW